MLFSGQYFWQRLYNRLSRYSRKTATDNISRPAWRGDSRAIYPRERESVVRSRNASTAAMSGSSPPTVK